MTPWVNCGVSGLGRLWSLEGRCGVVRVLLGGCLIVGEVRFGEKGAER